MFAYLLGDGKQKFSPVAPNLSSPHSGALLTTAIPHPIRTKYTDEQPIKTQTSHEDKPIRKQDNLNGSLPKDDVEVSSNSSHDSLSPKTNL